MKSLKSLIHLRTLNERLVLDGAVVGVVAGFFSISYRYVLMHLSQLRQVIIKQSDPSIIAAWFLFFLLAGYVVHWLLKYEPLSSGSGIPQIQGELLGVLDMNPQKVLLSKYIGGCLANISGLSLGREGPSIQIGASAAKICSNLMNRNATEKRYMITAGASAGLSAAFNAPISGVIFVLEEMHKSFFPIILIPTFIASVIADFLSKYVFGLAPAFSFTISSALPLSHYYHCVLLGILVAIVGVVFNKTLLGFQTLFKRVPVGGYIKTVSPFLVAGLLGYSYSFMLGGGHAQIENLISSDHAITYLVLLLIGKLVFTCFCYGSSVQGGIFLPILVLGAISGALYINIFEALGLLHNTYMANFIILAMAGVLTSVIRSPILSILLVTEMTGSFQHILSLCIIAITSYLMAELLNNKPIYDSLLSRMLDKNLDKVNSNQITLFKTRVTMDSPLLSKKIRGLEIPENIILLSINRHGEDILPKKDTILQVGDVITIMTDEEHLLIAKKFFETK